MAGPIQHQPTVLATRPRLRSRGGCVKCKLRKRKCDEAKPSCGACQKTQSHCRYPKDTSGIERDLFVRWRQNVKKIDVDVSDSSSPESQTDICRSLQADDPIMRISFLLRSKFQGANSPCSGAGANALTVLTELQFADDRDSLTWNCLDGMATVYWGSAQHDQSMLASGYKTMGKSLQRIQEVVAGDDTILTGDVVAAVSLARLFETMLPGSTTSWMIHAQGLSKLFEAMGPKAFQSPNMLRLLENTRWCIIMTCSVLHKPSIFNSSVWKTVPWEGRPKDIVQLLLDVYSRVPAIHAAWDDYINPDNAERQTDLELMLSIQLRQTVLELQEWRLEVDPIIADSVSEYKTADQEIVCPWRAPLAFKELSHAFAVALYNMIIIAISRYINQFPEVNDVAGPVSSSNGLLQRSLLPLGSPFQKACIAADEIAAVLPWTLQDRFRGAGSMYMGAPALVCDQLWRIFDPVKAQWFAETIVRINSSWNSLLTFEDPKFV